MQRLTSTLFFAYLFSALWASTGQIGRAQEWTRFRGPNGTGQSDARTIPVSWSTADYRWRVKLPGIGYSSPVVNGDRLFITSGDEQTATRFIRCLRTSDGGLIWKNSYESTPHAKHQFNAYAVGTPALDAERVYWSWGGPEHYIVLALDQQKGGELWRRDLGPFVAQHGFGASPIVFEDLVIVPNDQDGPSSIVALDAKTGETRWQTRRRSERAAYSTPCIYRPESEHPQLILVSTAHGVTGLDPRTGKLLWELGDVFDDRVVASPVVVGDLILAQCGTGGAGKRLIAVGPGDPETGTPAEIAYEIKGSLPYVCTPVAAGNLLFLWADRGIVTCVDAQTGQLVWRERVEGEYFGSPVRVGDRLYCMSREGEMVVLAAADQFKLLARFSLEEPTNSTPAVADGVMYVRTASHMMAIGGSGG
jgi:outer membrane protein assembly factor BamB